MRKLLLLLTVLAVTSLLSTAQTAPVSSNGQSPATQPTSQVSQTVPAPLSNIVSQATNITWLPKSIYTGGGGIGIKPSDKFAYVSMSNFLGAGTYSTIVIEERYVNGALTQCTKAGITKPMYQFGLFTAGLTGVGGGCVSSGQSASASATVQAFLDWRFTKKSTYGLTFTGTRFTDTSGFQFTIAPRYAQ